MPSVFVSPKSVTNTHDLALSHSGAMYGLKFANGFGGMQGIPITGASQLFNFQQTDWGGGRGRINAAADPTGYYDANHVWGLQTGKLFAVPQIRHAKGLRNEDTFFPGDGADSAVWKELYAQGAARYVETAFVASATYNADYARLIIRRIGNPGTLTVEHCANSAGDPGTVNKTVTLSASDIEPDAIVSLTHRYKFNWTSTQAQTSGTTYHIKAYGASTDNQDNHWEILVDNETSGSQISTNGTDWDAAGWKFYYRVCDADIQRRLRPFFFNGGWFVASVNDDGTDSKIYINGDIGTVSSATSTSLTKTGAGWTANRFSDDGAYVYIFSGPGEGQLRAISSNTTDTLTVSTWTKTPTTASKFAIIKTRWWKEITTSGVSLGAVKNSPAGINGVCFIPRGASDAVLRMTSAYALTAETNVYADQMETITNVNAFNLWTSVNSTSKVQQFTLPDSLTGVSLYTKLGVTRQIGSSEYQITNILAHDKKLYVLKENKMYSVAGSNTEEVSMALGQMPNRNNGVAAVSHMNYLYFSWAGSIERIIQGNASDILNFRPSYDGFPPTRKAFPSEAVSLLGWVAVAFDGDTSYTSSVMLWNDGGWMEMMRGYEAGARIRDLFVQTTYEQRPRMYASMDGDLVYQDFPLNDNNPLQDSGMMYEHECSIVTGSIDGNEAAYKKLYNKIVALTESLGTTGTISVDYQTDNDVWTDKWVPLPDSVVLSPRQDVMLNMGGLNKIALRFRIYTSKPSTPAICNGYRVEGWKSDDVRRQWVVRLSTGNEQYTRLSENDHKPEELLKWLSEMARNMNELKMHSEIDIFHGKKVLIHEPSVGPDNVSEEGWSGTFSMLIREA